MKTIDFELQYYYKRWLGALPVLIVNILLAALIGYHLQGALYYAAVLVLMVCSLNAYYKFTAKKGMFLTKGTLTIEDSKVRLSAYGREYELTDITELLGSTPTFYHSRCAMISADTSAGRIKLFSEPIPTDSRFSDSSLYPVWQSLLESFPALTPDKRFDQTADLWYKKQ